MSSEDNDFDESDVQEYGDLSTVPDLTIGDWVEIVQLKRIGRVVRTERNSERYLVRFRKNVEAWFDLEELKLRQLSPHLQRSAIVVAGIEIGSEVNFKNDEGELLRGTVLGYNRRVRTFTLRTDRLFEVSRLQILHPRSQRPCCCYP